MNIRFHRFASIAALAAATLAFAPRTAGAQTQSVTRQPAVVVTATRHPQDADTALAAITVITRADLERSQAPDLIAVLSQQAGIDVSRTGGPGQASTLFLRGANSNQTLILIDGIRVTATGSGLFDLAHLPPDQIERIEIVRGPRAALWGSDAIGGVIHIFTRDPLGSTVRLTAGRYGRAEASASTAINGDAGALGITAGYRHYDGFSATTPDAFGFDPDRDGTNNRNLSLRGNRTQGTQQLGLTLLATDADVEFDQGASSVRNVSGGLSIAGALSGAWTHRLTLGFAREDLDTPAFASVFDSRRQSADWVLSRPIADGVFSVGVSGEHEQGRSLGFDVVDFDRNRDTVAGFAAYGAHFGAQSLEAAARYDDNSQFGRELTGSAAWGWQFHRVARLRASWGQGFRAPNFNELYSPGFGGLFAGNPELHPERSRTVEAGLELTPATNQKLSLSWYRTRVGDLVAFDGANFAAVNIARTRMDGAELEYRVDGAHWLGRIAGGWQRARDRDSGAPLLRRPARKINGQLDYRFDRGWLLGVDAQAVAARADFGGDLGGYARIDLRASVPLDRQWRLEARLENLADRDYALARGFATAGRNLAINLIWDSASR